MKKWIGSCLTCAVVLAGAMAMAQEPGVVKPELVLREIVKGMPRGEQQEVRVVEVAFQPGDRTLFHTHRFPVTVYVLGGAFTMEMEGREPVTVKAGQSMMMPPQVKMTGYNRSGTEPLRLVAFYVSDPETPFLDPIREGEGRAERHSMLLVLVLALAASDGPHRSATLEPQLGASHSWAARSSTGRTLGGSWTFQVDAETGHVTGTWTVNDADRPGCRARRLVRGEIARRLDGRLARDGVGQRHRVCRHVGGRHGPEGDRLVGGSVQGGRQGRRQRPLAGGPPVGHLVDTGLRMTIAAPARDTIVNPLTSEEVTFVLTAGETNGEKAVVEIRIGPKAKGPPLHYHSAFTETFEVLEGELTLRVGSTTRRLTAGERLTVAVNQRHTFWSESDRPTRFRGTIEPASADVEHCFRIAFGLARDGLLSPSGVPKRLSHLAILATMSQSHLAGPASILGPIFRLLARTPGVRRTREALIRQDRPPADSDSLHVQHFDGEARA